MVGNVEVVSIDMGGQKFSDGGSAASTLDLAAGESITLTKVGLIGVNTWWANT